MKVSFCVHSYNEADALVRLVQSSLPLADLIREWVILDHRSDDATPEACTAIRALLRPHGIQLRLFREERDLSPRVTFADVRNATIRACRSSVVVLHDADFILGPGFRDYVERAVAGLLAPRSSTYAAAFTVPVLWDRLVIDDEGYVRDHGRVWVHRRRARIMLRNACRFEQSKEGGRWERLVPTTARRDVLALSAQRGGPLTPDTVLSVNVKAADRLALRDTMTMFMQDCVQGRTTRTWLADYAAGRTRSQGEYDFSDMSVVGWRLNSGVLELGGVAA